MCKQIEVDGIKCSYEVFGAFWHFLWFQNGFSLLLIWLITGGWWDTFAGIPRIAFDSLSDSQIQICKRNCDTFSDKKPIWRRCHRSGFISAFSSFQTLNLLCMCVCVPMCTVGEFQGKGRRTQLAFEIFTNFFS